MAHPAFLCANAISAASMLSLTTTATTPAASTNRASGTLGNAVKTGTGAGRLAVGGAFTGTADAQYVVQIHDISGGSEVGQAKYRWSDNGGASWNASGVTTSGAAATLSNGVTITFIGALETDFALYDQWAFKAFAAYAEGRTLEGSLASEFRSSDLTDFAIAVDLGAATAVDTVALYGLNSTGGAVTLQGNASPSWASPTFSQALTVANGKAYANFASQSLRYWRVKFVGMTSADAYLRVRKLWLGAQKTAPRPYEDGYSAGVAVSVLSSLSADGVEVGGIQGTARLWNVKFGVVSAAEKTAFDAVQTAIIAAGGVFFFYDPELAEVFYVRSKADLGFDHGFRGNIRASVGLYPMTLREITR